MEKSVGEESWRSPSDLVDAVSSAIERQSSEFDELRQELSRFDPLALATALAGLQARPSSAHFLWRLSVLATLATEVPKRPGARQLDRADLDRLLNHSSLAERARFHEDPLDSPLTEEVGFFAGSYLVGGGLSEEGVFAFRHLARGLFLLRDGLPEELVPELGMCGTAALMLSHWALRAAGLTPYLTPPEREDQLEIPTAAELIDLQKAMAFDRRLLAKLPSQAIPALDPLVREVGSPRLSDEQIGKGVADARPLLRAGEWIILARPFDVITALRHHYSVVAAETVGADRVERMFGCSVDGEVIEALRRMGMSGARTVVPRGLDSPFAEIRARVDVGRSVIALVLADDFKELAPQNPYSIWDASQLAGQIDQRVAEIAAQLEMRGEEGLCLMITQPAGRPALMPLLSAEGSALRTLTLTGANLEAISVLETASPLALWKFAEAENALREQSRINTSSMLDLYGAYRDKERTFGSLAGLNGVSFLPGLSGNYRCEAAALRNRHGATEVDGGVVEVERKELDASLSDRLHYEVELDTERVRVHISGSPLSLWVHGPTRDPSRSLDAVQSVAYWLADLCEPLAQPLAELAENLDALAIEVDFEPWDFWFEGGDDPGGEEAGTVSDLGSGVIELHLGPAIRRDLLDWRNGAERELVSLLIESIGRAREGAGMEAITPELAGEALETVAPLGVKKHLLMFPAQNNPLLAEADGPMRPVQEADLSAARDLLATELDARFDFRGEVVPTEHRAEVLKVAVDTLLAAAYELIAELSPEGLLESLVSQNERIIAAAEHRRVCLPARLATYPESAQRLRKDVLEANLAGICCRFLVERATAIPPQGARPWSLLDHDRAMALVAEALTWADLYDAIRGGLSSVDLLIREDDGWLRLTESDRFDSGRSRYFDHHVSNETRRSQERWEDRFQSDGQDGASGLMARFDQAMVDEAGVTLSRIGETLVAAEQLAGEAPGDLVVMAGADVPEMLAAKLIDDVPHEEIEQAIAYMTMGQREEFLKPPGGGKNDVYPWLFARRWSYNRRPFLSRITGEREEIIWGRRQVVAALTILGGQIGAAVYAKLAAAPALISELGRLGDELGAEFEGEVAAAVSELGLALKSNVKKLGTETLERNSSERLGDIDVLVADSGSRILWGIECKALNGSLSTPEVVREMSSHFGQEGESSISKHAERIAWLTDHIESALDLLQIPGSERDDWEVRGLFCTKRETMVPFIEEIPFDLVSIDELAAYLSNPPQGPKGEAG